jgi:hypothetical protein
MAAPIKAARAKRSIFFSCRVGTTEKKASSEKTIKCQQMLIANIVVENKKTSTTDLTFDHGLVCLGSPVGFDRFFFAVWIPSAMIPTAQTVLLLLTLLSTCVCNDDENSKNYWTASLASIRAVGGIVSSKLAYAGEDNERGVRAGEAIDAGELLLSVPDHMVLRLDDVSETSALSTIGALTLHLLRVLRSPTPVSDLNARDRSLALRFTASAACDSAAFVREAAAQLTYASGEHIKRIRSVYRDDRLAIVRLLNGTNVAGASLAEFDRVYCFAMSHSVLLKSFAASIDDSVERNARPDVLARPRSDFGLIPGVDLFAHSIRDNTVTAFENGQWTVRARLAFKQGSTVAVRYGSFSNVELVTYYGVVLDNNPYDVIHLDPQPQDIDVNRALKLALVARFFGPYSTRHYAKGGETGHNREPVTSGLSRNAIGALRIATLDTALVSSITVGRILSGDPAGPLLAEGNTWLVPYRGCEALGVSNKPMPLKTALTTNSAKAARKMRQQEWALAKECERGSAVILNKLQRTMDTLASRKGGGSAGYAAAAASHISSMI